MLTQIVFKADKSLKDKAMRKAQSDGLTLKAVLYHSLKLYVHGKLHFVLSTEEPEVEVLETTPSAQKKMDTIACILEKI